MQSAFISYSRDDNYFLTLLVGILDYYRVPYWHDNGGISLGAKYEEQIEQGLSNADSLLAILSENALRSTWMAREIASFRKEKPEGMIVPLLLQPVRPDELFKGLSDYQAVDFTNDMWAGFEQLLAFFGEPFLAPLEHRTGEDRRTGERRLREDRRRAPISDRLYQGMWKSYTISTGQGEAEPFGQPIGSIRQVAKLATVLSEPGSELARYEFRNRATGKVEEMTFERVHDLTYLARQDMEGPYTLKHAWVVERLAEILVERYEVRPLERRENERRSDRDRRQHRFE